MIFRILFSWNNDFFEPVSVIWCPNSYFSDTMTFSNLYRLHDLQTLIFVKKRPFQAYLGYMIFGLLFFLVQCPFSAGYDYMMPRLPFSLYIDHLEPVPVSCRPDSYYLHTMTISIRSQLHDIQTPIFVMQWLFQAGLGYMMSKLLFSWYNDFSNLSRLHDLQIFVKEMTIWSLSRLHYLQTPIFLVQWSFSAGYGYMISRLPFS